MSTLLFLKAKECYNTVTNLHDKIHHHINVYYSSNYIVVIVYRLIVLVIVIVIVSAIRYTYSYLLYNNDMTTFNISHNEQNIQS